MKKIMLSSAVLLFAVALLPMSVNAQQNGSGDQTGTSQSAEEKAAARQARVEEAKQNVANRLSSTEERRIAGLCNASQTIIAKLQTRVETATQSRESRYATVSEKLATLVEKLKVASVDTTALEAAITEMGTMVQAHVESMSRYQTALADLSEMDCATDPSGFKAVLLEVREQRKALVTQAQELRTQISVEVKAAITELRAQLAEESTEEDA